MQIEMKRACVAIAAATLLFAAGCRKSTPVPVASNAAPPPKPVGVGGPKAEPPKALAPTIDSFTVEPSSIERGQSATLRWSASNATSLSIDQGLGTVAATGSRQVFPGATTTYTLTANSAVGTVTRSATVEVNVPPSAPATTPAKPPGRGGDDPRILSGQLQDIYFDYDMSELREDARRALNVNSDLLRRIFAADPNFIIVVEGHCDERGSAEYNLGLGDRRATSARDYLVQLGVPAARLRTISFGEERPQCTDASEACYQRNRRAHLIPAQ